MPLLIAHFFYGTPKAHNILHFSIIYSVTVRVHKSSFV